MKRIILILVLLASLTEIFASFINTIELPDEVTRVRGQKINEKIDSLKKLDQVEQLKELNRFFNFNIKYGSDIAIYGKSNHIATIEETILTMRGDCDDYVMAKLQAARYLGFKDITLFYSLEKGVKHIKLLIKVDGVDYVLDSYNKKFRELTKSEWNKKGNKAGPGNLYVTLIKEKQKIARYSTNLKTRKI